MEPREALSAAAAPDIPANSMEARIFTWASPPRICPTRALQKLTILLVIPALFINSPARINRGIAIILKESMVTNIRWGTTVRGTVVFPQNRAAKLAKHIPIAIGHPSARSARNTIIKILNMSTPPRLRLKPD